jgi:N-acetylmuramoyl-L-alanine amidase
VLVEAGVIANPDEARRLAQADTIEHLARAIADGVAQCLKP